MSQPSDPFSSGISALALGILQALEGRPEGATAWELKLELKAPLSQVHLALGLLLSERRARVTPERLGYRVTRERAQTRESAAQAAPA